MKENDPVQKKNPGVMNDTASFIAPEGPFGLSGKD